MGWVTNPASLLPPPPRLPLLGPSIEQLQPSCSPARGPGKIWLARLPPRTPPKKNPQTLPFHPPTLHVAFSHSKAQAGWGMLWLMGTEGNSSRMTNLAKSRVPSPRGGVGGSVPVLSHPRSVCVPPPSLCDWPWGEQERPIHPGLLKSQRLQRLLKAGEKPGRIMRPDQKRRRGRARR